MDLQYTDQMTGEEYNEIVENATITDIALLTELRLEYLKEDMGELSEDDVKIIRQDLPDYFKKNLNQNFFCYLIRDKEEIVANRYLFEAINYFFKDLLIILHINNIISL